jgi:integrase
MTELTDRSEAATPGAASIHERLRSLSQRPASLTVRDVIDRYMAQYAGRDSTRDQRLTAWQSMIGDFTLEQCDSDLMHAGRSELATKPALVYKGKDHRGIKMFDIKSRRKPKDPATLNRYMVAISAVFTWAMEQRLAPKAWLNPCRGIKRLREAEGRVRFLDAQERERLFDAVRGSKWRTLMAARFLCWRPSPCYSNGKTS